MTYCVICNREIKPDEELHELHPDTYLGDVFIEGTKVHKSCYIEWTHEVEELEEDKAQEERMEGKWSSEMSKLSK